MNIHVKRDEILALANQTAKAVPKKTTDDLLKGIHIEADAKRSILTLTATNHEIAIRASMPATVRQSGSVIVNARLLLPILSHLPEKEVDFQMDGAGQLCIRSSTTGYDRRVQPGDKYPMPELPFPDDTVPVSGLRSLSRSTLFAVAEGTDQPILHCVRLSIGPDGLKASGSNSFCIIEAEGDPNCKGRTELLLPAHSLKVLASISQDSDVYEMGLAGKSVVFWNGSLLFSARLMEGTYPNLEKLLDGFQGKYAVNLNAEELSAAVNMVLPMDEKDLRVELAFGEHELHIRSVTAYSNASSSVKALVLNAPKTPFYYNAEKLLDYLTLLKGDVTLEFDARGFLSIRPGDTRYMQSPMRPPKEIREQVQKAA